MKNERPEVKAAKNERFFFKGSFLICWKWGKWIFIFYTLLFFFLFQIKSVHSLDCDQESVWHVYHVCDCPQFHCSGFWRSCLRKIWKEQIFGICRLWFHCHLYIGMLFKGQFSPFIHSLALMYIDVFLRWWIWDLCFIQELSWGTFGTSWISLWSAVLSSLSTIQLRKFVMILYSEVRGEWGDSS